MRLIRLVVVLAAVAAAAPTGTSVAAHAQARIVDRTFSCAPVAFGGVGDLDVDANPLREDTFGRRFVATLDVRTGSYGANSTLVVARAQQQPEHPGLAYEYAARGAAGVFAHSRRCTPTRARLPLSPRGIGGPPVVWQKTLDCPVRGRVLVRVRAVLERPADWRRADRFYAGVRQPLVSTKLAVRLQSGKPVAYMEHDAKGGTKLWFGPSCG